MSEQNEIAAPPRSERLIDALRACAAGARITGDKGHADLLEGAAEEISRLARIKNSLADGTRMDVPPPGSIKWPDGGEPRALPYIRQNVEEMLGMENRPNACGFVFSLDGWAGLVADIEDEKKPLPESALITHLRQEIARLSEHLNRATRVGYGVAQPPAGDVYTATPEAKPNLWAAANLRVNAGVIEGFSPGIALTMRESADEIDRLARIASAQMDVRAIRAVAFQDGVEACAAAIDARPGAPGFERQDDAEECAKFLRETLRPGPNTAVKADRPPPLTRDQWIDIIGEGSRILKTHDSIAAARHLGGVVFDTLNKSAPPAPLREHSPGAFIHCKPGESMADACLRVGVKPPEWERATAPEKRGGSDAGSAHTATPLTREQWAHVMRAEIGTHNMIAGLHDVLSAATHLGGVVFDTLNGGALPAGLREATPGEIIGCYPGESIADARLRQGIYPTDPRPAPGTPGNPAKTFRFGSVDGGESLIRGWILEENETLPKMSAVLSVGYSIAITREAWTALHVHAQRSIEAWGAMIQKVVDSGGNKRI